MDTSFKMGSRLYAIDLLRFVAAVSVVIFHYTFFGYNSYHLNPIEYEYFEPITKYFYLGVELFFVISGYVVLMSAYGKTIKQFFISRVVRLYPMFWIACTVTFLMVILFGLDYQNSDWPESMRPTIVQYAVNMTMLQGFLGYDNIDGVYWTLTTEISFYFLISLLLSYGLFKNIKLFLYFWLIYTAAAQVSAAVNTPFHYLFIPKYSSFFIAGMLFYLFQNRILLPVHFYSMISLAYVLCIRSAWVEASEHTEVFHKPHSVLTVALIITLIFILFFLIINEKLSMQKYPWLSWLGGITYPLYLLHGNIGYILFQRLERYFDKYILLIIVLVAMLLVSYLMHRFIEKAVSRKLKEQLTGLMNRLEN